MFCCGRDEVEGGSGVNCVIVCWSIVTIIKLSLKKH